MTWVRTEDGTVLHPKFFRAGVAAHGWWSGGLGYCNRNLTDGFIPTRDVDLVYPGTPHEVVLALIEALIQEGLLHTIAPGRRADCRSPRCRPLKAPSDGYLMHDYLDYQPSRKHVTAKRRAMSRIGRQGGERSGERRKRNASQPDKRDAQQPANPVPSRPVPSRPDRTTIAPDGAFQEFYGVFPRKKAPRAARRAWDAAIKKASPNDLLVALRRQLPEFARRPADRVPYPATWLNGEHWRNEPDEHATGDPYADYPELFDCNRCGKAHPTRMCPTPAPSA